MRAWLLYSVLEISVERTFIYREKKNDITIPKETKNIHVEVFNNFISTSSYTYYTAIFLSFANLI